MKRTIYKTLLNWKNQNKQKPLLIRGARQVGKSYIVNKFGKNEFDNFIVLNFERNPEYNQIFTSLNPQEIIEQIILFTGKNISDKTLIFLDEIQECPKAIMSLRYFYEEMPTISIIGAGSLLEFTLQAEDYRMPVGRIQYLYMYPLSFIEFLIAINEKPLSKYILSSKNTAEISDELHLKLLNYIRKYFIIGGMPEVVNEYITSKNIINCQKIQHTIIETYQDDFAKYAKKSQYKYVQKVFLSIPKMIGQKIIFSHIDKSIKARDLKNAFELLTTAGIFYKVKRTSGAGLPLEASVKNNFFKAIFLDVGLLHAINGLYSETIKEEDLNAIYKGAVAEQFVGQEFKALSKNYHKTNLYYWARESKNSNAEIDYLIVKNENILPVEVKSGKKGTLRSLIQFQKKFNTNNGIKISQAKYKKEENLISFPFYTINQLI